MIVEKGVYRMHSAPGLGHWIGLRAVSMEK